MANTHNGLLKDGDYDLISVVYHASQGAETCRQYASDAKAAGDRDASAYFDEVQQQLICPAGETGEGNKRNE
jgi:hypothetical protein